ncbi:2-hydroxychromene-2-carboxylate isomerase [Rivibacter subsaxonicus]|uniref:2-hydroxychromene-2-carboxylate isomerase n=1 Tax=Rivibacter subsaxonicus TaxID=457575 RepID=A0A4Q7VZ53_9BURK|nr:2-hydroxychromene-2-carboxylate isomerase [Rivibacter subsaxonicus]RZU02114.1 2-hydroxychromene-2-carboxylate isomerase [Rivibacter subsaxonicus]
MTPISFWFDPISPYAWLAFERLPQALEGCSYVVRYRPVLLAGLLKHWGQRGPAEIAPKRNWTYRQVQWLAQRQGTPLQVPAAHPFNPLPLLRLLHACDDSGLGPNRWQCEQVLRHVWEGGAAVDDPQRMSALTQQLAPALDPAAEPVKAALRAAGDDAVARGIFGVPTLELPPRAGESEARLFWGLDSLEMVAGALRGDPWFDGPAWAEGGRARPGIERR